MTPKELDACLGEFGLSEDAFAHLAGADVSQVRRWRQGIEAIPQWVPMSLLLIEKFRAGAAERGPARVQPASMRSQAPADASGKPKPN